MNFIFSSPVPNRIKPPLSAFYIGPPYWLVWQMDVCKTIIANNFVISVDKFHYLSILSPLHYGISYSSINFIEDVASRMLNLLESIQQHAWQIQKCLVWRYETFYWFCIMSYASTTRFSIRLSVSLSNWHFFFNRQWIGKVPLHCRNMLIECSNNIHETDTAFL